MTVFTEPERSYLESNRLGRLATVGPDGMPHAAPLRWFYDHASDTLILGGHEDFAATKKFRDARRHGLATLIIDDIASFDPFTPRGIEIRGRAETHTEGGEELGKALGVPYPLSSAWIRLIPVRVVSWGLEGEGFAPPSARTVAATNSE
jgi:pyridoxamine 5'-phosphate oxidase family protein